MNLHTSFHCTPAKVKDIRNWISQALGEAGVDADILSKILLAASEAVTNCIVHGYDPSREGRVDVTLDVDGPAIQLTVRDYGSGLQMDQYDAPDTNKAAEGGYGIYLIRSLMDDVRLVPQPDGTELRMSISTDRTQVQ